MYIRNKKKKASSAVKRYVKNYNCALIKNTVISRVPSAIIGQQQLSDTPTLKARSFSATAEKATKHALIVATSCLLLLA